MLFFFRFESNLPYSDQLPVRLISDQVLSHVEFRSSPDPTAKNLLSKLCFRFSSVNVDHTVTSTNRDSRNSNDTSLFTELSLVAEVIDGPNDDFDTNEDSNNSDGGEDGGGENGSDDSCMVIGEGNEITTCIKEEHELPQEILVLSLAETVKGLAEPASHEMKMHP